MWGIGMDMRLHVTLNKQAAIDASPMPIDPSRAPSMQHLVLFNR
jgi:hypothetical protein